MRFHEDDTLDLLLDLCMPEGTLEIRIGLQEFETLEGGLYLPWFHRAVEKDDRWQPLLDYFEDFANRVAAHEEDMLAELAEKAEALRDAVEDE